MERVLVLGADGFIGRHIAFALRNAGMEVLASARNTSRLKMMGFETLGADLCRAETHKPDYWRSHLASVSAVVNVAGLLNANATKMRAVHVDAPKAVYAALGCDARIVHISAVGIDQAQTEFAVSKLAGEAIAAQRKAVILRPGLVMADTSYGGTSLARALAILPFATPVVGDGAQVFNPIHASDLAQAIIACLRTKTELTSKPLEIGGPERVTQGEMLQALRNWLGLRSVPIFKLPLGVAKLLGGIGDSLRLGPISRVAVAQLEYGVEVDEVPLAQTLGLETRGFSTFLNARPAGSQDLWHARLYLMRPTLRMVLAFLWLASGIIGLTLPAQAFLPMLTTSFPDTLMVILARLGGVADLAIALALIRNWKPGYMAVIQTVMVGGYTLVFSALAPTLWLLPLGGLLKNLPILALIGVSAILEDER